MADPTPQRDRNLALIFPGQGSQHAGMGRRVAERSPGARDVFAQASDILKLDVSRLVMDGSEKDLARTTTTQPAILAVSWAYYTYLRELATDHGRQLKPSLVSGHSFGQFSASAAAGSLSFADALKLVKERGRIMAKWSKRRPGGMAPVIGVTDEDVRDVCSRVSPDGDVGVAAINAPGQTVISGTLAALARAVESCKERGARVVQLPISVPGHFPKMSEAREELRRSSTASSSAIRIARRLQPHRPRADDGRRSPAGAERPDDRRDQLDARVPGDAQGRRVGVLRARARPRARRTSASGSTATREMIDIFDESQWRDLILGGPPIEAHPRPKSAPRSRRV